MNLSKNLTLAEAIRSDNAKRAGIDNSPTPSHLITLEYTALNLFQPVRDHFGVPIFVSSMYRSSSLNMITPNASATSQHSKGEAIDFDNDGIGYVTNAEIFEFIKNNIDFDQLIWEFGDDDNPAWVHASIRADGKNRGQVLKSYRVGNKVKFEIIK